LIKSFSTVPLLGWEGSQIRESQKTCHSEKASGIKHKIMKDHFFIHYRTRFLLACLLLSGIMFFNACQPGTKRQNAHNKEKEASNTSASVRYAVGFDLVPEDGYELLHIFRHYNETADTLSYVLANEGVEIPEIYADLEQIRIPVRNIALLHSSYLSYFDFCNAKNHIKAISEGKYVFDDSIYQAIQNDDLREVGYGENLDKEQLLALGIDLVVTVGWPNSPNKNQEMLHELGIPLLIFSDWQESTLMGRMEWVKVIAALTGKEAIANTKFKKIAGTYDSLKQLTSGLENLPKIVCNLPYKGSWYVPSGNSYVSNLLRDAGGRYLWADDRDKGALQLDFETVFATGVEADFWINPDFAHSIEDIYDKDERLRDFRSTQSGNVYNSINRIARGEANDYWESGIVNPHLVLADIIHILHPEILPDHQLVYYKRID
jgi:iron complex transport system substrate-binding protein